MRLGCYGIDCPQNETVAPTVGMYGLRSANGSQDGIVAATLRGQNSNPSVGLLVRFPCASCPPS